MGKQRPDSPNGFPKVVNAKNFQITLDSLKKEYETNLGGHHQRIYALMASAMHVALFLRSNKKLKKRFLRHVKSKRSSGGLPINIVTEVMFYVAGASSESARKIAWKRGRVIEFLHDEGIKIAKIASEIKTRGGIGAVLKQATKENPRREKVPAEAKNSAKKSKPVVVKAREEEDRDTSGSDEADVTPTKSAAGSRRNDRKVIVPLLINLSDRDMLDEFPIGSRVRIVATRTDEKGAKIEANRIKKSKSEVREENDSAWD
jgi:hypothetical protein